MTNATTSKGWDVSEENAELIAEARAAALEAGSSTAEIYNGLADALEAATKPPKRRTRRTSNLHDPIPKMRVFPVDIKHADGSTSIAFTAAQFMQGGTLFESKEDARR